VIEFSDVELIRYRHFTRLCEMTLEYKKKCAELDMLEQQFMEVIAQVSLLCSRLGS